MLLTKSKGWSKSPSNKYLLAKVGVDVNFKNQTENLTA